MPGREYPRRRDPRFLDEGPKLLPSLCLERPRRIIGQSVSQDCHSVADGSVGWLAASVASCSRVLENKIDVAKMTIVLAELSTIGNEFECYAVDVNQYPSGRVVQMRV